MTDVNNNIEEKKGFKFPTAYTILFLLIILVVANCLYTLDMTEQAIITYFGEPV